MRALVALLALVLMLALPATAATSSECSNCYPQAPAWLERLIDRTWPAKYDETSECVAYKESRYVVGAVSPTSDYGLWQFNAVHHTWVDLKRVLRDPVYAAKKALRLSRGGRSWWAWTGTYARGMCRHLS